MSSSTASGDESKAVVRDLYNLVISELKKASLVCPAPNAAPYFNLVVLMEVPDGINARGKFIIYLTLILILFCFHLSY
jgi:hypothetical protein